VGAYVTVNCQHTYSKVKVGYSLKVRSGAQYKAVARFEDPATGKTLYGEGATGGPSDPPIAPGDTVPLDVNITDPPQCLRNVVVECTVRVDDVYLTGADHDEQRYRRTLYVQFGVPRFNADTGAWEIDEDDPVGGVARTDRLQVGASVGDANGQLRIEAEARRDLSVNVQVTGMLEDLMETRTVQVPPGASRTIGEFDLDSGGPFNDRAYFRGITITNQTSAAI
jgi:hypothetical protein